MIDPQLTGKVALITGANNPAGIGAAAARALAVQGVSVFITAVDGGDANAPRVDDLDAALKEGGEPLYHLLSAQPASRVVESITAAGGRAAWAAVDLMDVNAIAPLFDTVEAAFGGVDILINNAAYSKADTFAPSADAIVNQHSVEWLSAGVPTLTAASHDAHFAVNTRAPALMMVEFARRHVNRGGRNGCIINMTTDGSPAFPSEIAYGASKHALESYTRAAALELGQFGIRVNCVSPGPTQTGWMTANMQREAVGNTPLRRAGMSDDLADVITFLASHQARWITGQVIHVNGGHQV